ncbi:patatin-like phospholipase family protein [Maribellus maritimus]|uniref:patatin-like phospholipase family protein n=1 Tax=Maribellus maritimus TaxID=2870838 RepID=UPI001EEA884F|nr:patatin-like phospholipase family protein [Maribellus maritimus]MCG6189823.1 patatin-like phospholipase family protein [Maribellus maritimus]
MKKNVALVLGSGGARGLAHIGVINELEEQGFNITSVSGTSIGSLIGGFCAMGKLNELTEWLTTLQKKDVYSLMDPTLSTNGLLKAEKVFRKLNTIIPDVLIEEMNIPFAAVATDVINREEVIFTIGSFYKAARASIAIPTIITPVISENSILVDGGLLNPIPANRVKRTEGDILVVVNLYDSNNPDILLYEEDVKKHLAPQKSSISNLIILNNSINNIIKRIQDFIPTGNKNSQGYYSLIQFTTSAMLEQISKLSLELNKPDILINIPFDAARTFEFYKAKELIEAGRKAARFSINQYNIQSEKYADNHGNKQG